MGRCLDADALCHMPSLHSIPLILRRHFQAELHKLGDQGRQAKIGRDLNEFVNTVGLASAL